MCGIAGIFFKRNLDLDLLNRFELLVEQKQHKRGPDGFNKAEVFPNLYFFHNMLSIIDIGNAVQPMQDETGAITYNGEVYNYKELKLRDTTYTKNSDTEVLLKGLNREYVEFLKKTNSMFGLGYCNKQKGVLTLCRDRIGKKPLYYIETPEIFAFASTITPLTIFSNRRLNHKSLWQYYLNRAFKAPETIFDDIFELPAGSYLPYSLHGKSKGEVVNWWHRKPVQDLYNDENEIIENIECLLNDAIKNRLVADVPVGLFLSGGVDSSLIAALTAKQMSGLKSFTVSFYDKRYDESEYARSVCQRFGIEYNEIKVGADDFLNNIENWISVQDDIVADPSALLLYKISEFASSMNFRVLLAGEGSDELFGGYNSYKYFGWSEKIYARVGKRLPVLEKLLPIFSNDSKKYNFLYNSFNKPVFYGTAMIFEPHLLKQLICQFDESKSEKEFDLKNMLDLDIRDRLPNDVLTRSDRSSSGTSVELRVPFLAHQLVDYSAGISSGLLMKGNTSKYLIKKLASKYLDHDLIYRKKVGFDLPIGKWISKELRPMLEFTINNSVQKDYVDIEVIKKLANLHMEKNIDYSSKLWAFLCLELSFRHLTAIK